MYLPRNSKRCLRDGRTVNVNVHLTVARVALDHLVARLEACVRDFGDRELLMEGFLGRNDWGVRGKREVNSRIWNLKQVCQTLTYI